MRIMNILHDSIVDGEGFRTVVFFAGCPHHCEGCHNPQSWNILNGTEMTKEDVLMDVLGNELTQVTLSGGEPFLQSQEVAELARSLREAGKNIWCYTGYTFEALLTNPIHKELLASVDVLVDGKFELKKRDIGLLYKGSSNQRIIDVQRSLREKKIVLHNKRRSLAIS